MRSALPAIIAAAMLIGCAPAARSPIAAPAVASAETRIPVRGVAAKIVAGARSQLASPARYTGEYFSLRYPGGDPPPDKGACVDVVIRALRPAGYDLQKLIYEDAAAHPSAYPRIGRIDRNIDHRRVPNQRRFFERHGKSLSTRTDGAAAREWRPGDIVSWRLDNGLDHIGVLSDLPNRQGLPYVIHNLERTAEEDVLRRWKITGHYRYP